MYQTQKELALTELEIDLLFLESLQYQFEMLSMFLFVLAEYQDIIHVDQNKVKIFEQEVTQSLRRTWSILHSKWHHYWFPLSF